MANSRLAETPQLEVITTDSAMPVRCFISEDYGSYVPLHYHPALELIYVIEGSMCFIAPSKELEELLQLSPDLTQQFYMESGVEAAAKFPVAGDVPNLRMAKLPSFPAQASISVPNPNLNSSNAQSNESAAQSNPANLSTNFKMFGNSTEPVHRDNSCNKHATSYLTLQDSSSHSSATVLNIEDRDLALSKKPKKRQAACSTPNHNQGALNLDLEQETTEEEREQVYEQELRSEGFNCVLFNTNELHATLCSVFNRSLVLQIPFDFLQSNLGIRAEQQVHFALAVASQTCLERMQQALSKLVVLINNCQQQQQIFAKEIYFKQALYTILECLLEVMVSLPHVKSKKSGDHLYKQRIYGVIDYINNHYAEELPLSAIAEQMHVHPNYFCRIFKQVVGQTFHEYITEVRLSHIYQDLLNTSDSVAVVTARNGIVCNNFFYTIFKRRFHCTPVMLRKRYSRIED